MHLYRAYVNIIRNTVSIAPYKYTTYNSLRHSFCQHYIIKHSLVSEFSNSDDYYVMILRGESDSCCCCWLPWWQMLWSIAA